MNTRPSPCTTCPARRRAGQRRRGGEQAAGITSRKATDRPTRPAPASCSARRPPRLALSRKVRSIAAVMAASAGLPRSCRQSSGGECRWAPAVERRGRQWRQWRRRRQAVGRRMSAAGSQHVCYVLCARRGARRRTREAREAREPHLRRDSHGVFQRADYKHQEGFDDRLTRYTIAALLRAAPPREGGSLARLLERHTVADLVLAFN